MVAREKWVQRPWTIFLVLVGLLSAPPATAHIFETIDVPGSDLTVPRGINDSGQIVGQFRDAQSRLRGFVLSGGVFTTIDGPDALVTAPFRINDSGQIVGSFQDTQGFVHGFLLSEDVFTTIDVPGAVETRVQAINNSGQMVGEFIDAQGDHGFLLSGGVFTTIDAPGARRTQAIGINDSGQILGVFSDGSRNHGFLLSGDVFTTIDVPGASGTEPIAINNSGQILGRFFSIGIHSFLLSGGVFTTIKVPGAQQTGAIGMNNSGQIVGAFVDAQGGHNFLLSGAVFTTFDVPGARVSGPRAINDSGQIVGQFVDAQGRLHGFLRSVSLVDPVPDLLDGPAVTVDLDVLASKGQPVRGVAADGVTQVVVRIPATSPGEQFVLTLLNEAGTPSSSTDEDGALDAIGTGIPNQGIVTVSADATDVAGRPLALALYRAPVDFPRPGQLADVNRGERRVLIDVESLASGKRRQIPVSVVRPPVVLIHGLWSDLATWDFFQPLVSPPGGTPDPRFEIFRVAYDKSGVFGVLENAISVRDQLRAYIRKFKKKRGVAAVQFDVVAHSMGGLIARALPILPPLPVELTYEKGMVHKLITLNTPHLGSEFATRLLASSSLCHDVLAGAGRIVGGAVTDLDVLSALLQNLQVPRQGIQAHFLKSEASPSQESAAESRFDLLQGDLVCLGLLGPGGFQEVFSGPNDLVVSARSQDPIGFEPALPATVHTVIPFLFPLGRDVLQRDLDSLIEVVGASPFSAPRVIQLLNEPVNGPEFSRITP